MNHNIQLLSNPSHFSCLPNEVLLIIWTYVGHAEAIRIFGLMKCQRYTDLLEEYCYRTINFREISLSTFLLYCSRLFQIIRFNIQTLKLGHRTSYCQLRLFKQMHPGKWRRETFFSTFYFFSVSIPLSEMFPKLHTLVLYNIPPMSDEDLQYILTLIPFLQRLTIAHCSLQAISSAIYPSLLAHGLQTSQLRSCTLCSDERHYGFIFYEPISSIYQIQESLIHLRIDIHDLISLKNLLRFLPKLVTLGKCTSSKRKENK